MKKRFCLLAAIGMSALVLGGCNFEDLMFWKNKEEEQQQKEETPSGDQSGQQQQPGGDQPGGSGDVTPPHTHTFSDEWSHDETHHWHAATCEHTDEKSDYAEHTFVKNEDETEETCICGETHVLVSSLAAPTNLAYALGKLTFDPVEHAKRYLVEAFVGNCYYYRS